jgi:hypothetical protein
MNLIASIVGIFSTGLKGRLNGHLDQIAEAGRDDARLTVGTYLDAFDAEAAAILADRQRRMIGIEGPQQPHKGPRRIVKAK